MSGFTYDAKLFSKAAMSIDDAADLFSRLTELISDVTTSYPPDYKCKALVHDACDCLKNANKFTFDYRQKMMQTGSSLRSLSSGGAVTKTTENSWWDDIKDSFGDTGSAWYSGVRSLLSGHGFSGIGEAIKQTGSTVAVGYTSAMSGGLKILELINDGQYVIEGSRNAIIAKVGDVITGSNNASKILDNTLDFIRRDRVNELNDFFYNETSIGKSINNKSNLKYDSKGAGAIRAGSQFVVELAAATGASVATGGAAAPIALGALFGAGRGAENYAKGVNRELGEKYDYEAAFFKTSINAATGALEWWGYKNLGTSLYNSVRYATPMLEKKFASFSLSAIKESFKNTAAHISFSSVASSIANFKNVLPSYLKAFAKNYVNNIFAYDSILDEAAVVADHYVNVKLGDETAAQFVRNVKNELIFAFAIDILGTGIKTSANYKFVNGDFSDIDVSDKELKDIIDGYFSKDGSDIGINQHCLADINVLRQRDKEIYEVIHANIPTFDMEDAINFAYNLDNPGACSPTARLNMMMRSSGIVNDPDTFRLAFNYDFKNPKTGKVNEELLLADFYSYLNKENRTLINDAGKYINPGSHEGQIYPRNRDFVEFFDSKLDRAASVYGDTAVKKYRLEWSGSSMRDHTSQFFNDTDIYDSFKSFNSRGDKGVLSLNLDKSTKPVRMLKLTGADKGAYYMCDEGHAVDLLSVKNTGALVESWGNIFYIDSDTFRKIDWDIDCVGKRG